MFYDKNNNVIRSYNHTQERKLGNDGFRICTNDEYAPDASDENKYSDASVVNFVVI